MILPEPPDRNPAPDWYEAGCAYTCREKHTYQWGSCAHANEPPPTLTLFKRVDMSDGFPSLVMQTLTAGDVAEWLREQGYTVTDNRTPGGAA